jgi:hypothetical protein
MMNAEDWKDAPNDIREAWVKVCPVCKWHLCTKDQQSFTQGFKCYNCETEFSLSEWPNFPVLKLFTTIPQWEQDARRAISILNEKFGKPK